MVTNMTAFVNCSFMRCGENIEAVLMSVEATPKKSVRRRSAELGVSQSSVHRILRHDLKMKPYHISVHQGLTPENALQKRTMCAWFLRQVREEEDFLRSVWFSDEAHFYLSGTVNSRNCVHWASERPDEVIERNLHVTKATAELLDLFGSVTKTGQRRLLQLIDI